MIEGGHCIAPEFITFCGETYIILITHHTYYLKDTFHSFFHASSQQDHQRIVQPHSCENFTVELPLPRGEQQQGTPVGLHAGQVRSSMVGM